MLVYKDVSSVVASRALEYSEQIFGFFNVRRLEKRIDKCRDMLCDGVMKKQWGAKDCWVHGFWGGVREGGAGIGDMEKGGVLDERPWRGPAF